MNRVAIALNTCDRTELTKRSIEPLLQPDKFDLHWVDGSKTEAGQSFIGRHHPEHRACKRHWQIRGGSGPAIVYALTTMLQSGYEFCGLVENDVLLDKDWFAPTMELFEIGVQDGIEVGAVSARAYEDRILIQRDGYAVMHNLGAGMIIFSRKAAKLVLHNYRTTWTTENRLVFAQLSGIDIGGFWAFRGEQQFLVADWGFDKVLAANGLASLALTPNKVTMIDQPIEPLGLKYADGKFAMNPNIFETYRDSLARVRSGELKVGIHHPFFNDGSTFIIFAHQIPQIGGEYIGDWRVRDFMPFGPFCWKCGEDTPGGECAPPHPKLTVPISGPCEFIVSGGEHGGKIRIEDEHSGYVAEPSLPPEDGTNFLTIPVPATAAYRNIKLTALDPGVCLFAIKTREPQPTLPYVKFDYSTLPPV
jgi:hypothetical protein